jgi:Rhs element Vgr protein
MNAVTVTLLSGGQPAGSHYELLSAEITREVNRLPDARLVLLDGDPARRTFALSDAVLFEPGREIELKLRYEGGADATVFKGLVVRHGVSARPGGSTLTIELRDAAIKLAHARKSAIFRDQGDDEIIAKLARDAKLEFDGGGLAATEPKHAELVQYRATDWDFMLARADVQGLLVSVDDGVVRLGAMAVAGAAAYTVRYGIDEVYDLELEIDAASQYQDVAGEGWDVKNQQPTQASEAEAAEASQGNLDGGKLAAALGFAPYVLSHPVPVEPRELEAWADARLARSRLSLIRGRLSLPGFAGAKLLDTIELEGVGERFDGRALVTGVRHSVDEQGWRTELRLGLSPAWFCREPEIEEAPAAGLLPSARGLQVGVVDAFEDDPAGELRVKVRLPALGAEGGAVWARLASPDAGPGRGYVFRPEAGDEVVVGFLNGDPRQPVILGAMYSSANAPADGYAPAEDNAKRAIVTKKGSVIGFVDADKASVFIETPQGNKLLLDDEGEAITLTDQHGNSITLGEKGIALQSAKDIVIEADGDVEIKGANVNVA